MLYGLNAHKNKNMALKSNSFASSGVVKKLVIILIHMLSVKTESLGGTLSLFY